MRTSTGYLLKTGLFILLSLFLSSCGGGGKIDELDKDFMDSIGLGGSGNNAATSPKLGKVFVEQSSANTAKVTWQAATDDATTPDQMGYEIHVSETANFTPSDTTRRTQVFGVTEAEISGLETGKTYYVLVVAVDKQGDKYMSRTYST